MSVRIHATDLQAAARESAAIRAEADARGEQQPQVLLDIEVIIDRSVAAAFKLDSARAQSGSAGTVRYVGTPRGLAGLISDVQRLGIADGVVLLTCSEDRVVGLMLDELATGLGGARSPVAA